ncbi:MAG: YARHG domain-containing protein [Candidatus Margulisbacteria bacterium]|jgi:hypothetical protein|nr:YARHG domain-containing protein [Candidatus Margulisiibacteriota bacterium]
MRRVLLLLFCLVPGRALDYVYQPAQVLFAGRIQERRILLTPRQVCLWSGQYYEPVYQLPEAVSAARRDGDILRTDRYSISFTPAVRLTPDPAPALRPAAVPDGKYLLREPLKNIYVREDLDRDGVREIIFRQDGVYYLASTNADTIRQAAPLKLTFDPAAHTARFSFVYRNKPYTFEKRGQIWNRDTAEDYSADALHKMSAEELELLRALIEARKGRIFANKKIQDYLQKQSWYFPDAAYTPECLTQKELQNIETIFAVENAKLREGLYEEKIILP